MGGIEGLPRLCPRKRGIGRFLAFVGETSTRESSAALFGRHLGRSSLVGEGLSTVLRTVWGDLSE
ncbi:hypothetical protein MPNT_50126 [Candidatus Methylacidithermus pantelleriae]|uniref:Uncharacterized protein n=1 Tax=Candidatus Methylacidithermus pantelleriae TaxID=2744239 RepID=A0A8J2FT50_9BACT|nr:hypothetical protein MPNT_50126 [Candidatus Methylacidithermus pantelleriae]